MRLLITLTYLRREAHMILDDDKYISPYLLLPLRSLAQFEREWIERHPQRKGRPRLRLVKLEEHSSSRPSEATATENRKDNRS